MNINITLGNLLLWIVILCIVGFSIMTLALHTSAPNPDLEFKVGSEVHLVIGGRGQVISISGDQYKVRIWGLQGIESYWFYEWELEAPIVDPFNPMLPRSPGLKATTQDILEWRYKA